MDDTPTLVRRDDGTAASRRTPPEVAELFAGFLSIGLLGFGGVLPWARRMMVEQRRWLTGAEFTDLLALCQFLPGPNIVNMSVALGNRFRGVRGAFAAICALLLAPMAIVVALGAVYLRYRDAPAVGHGFTGLAAGASGLVLAMAAKIAWPLRRSPVAVGVACVTVAVIGLLRLPLLPALVVLAPLSVLAMSRARP